MSACLAFHLVELGLESGVQACSEYVLDVPTFAHVVKQRRRLRSL